MLVAVFLETQSDTSPTSEHQC